jgi:hypothetical protein
MIKISKKAKMTKAIAESIVKLALDKLYTVNAQEQEQIKKDRNTCGDLIREYVIDMLPYAIASALKSDGAAEYLGTDNTLYFRYKESNCRIELSENRPTIYCLKSSCRDWHTIVGENTNLDDTLEKYELLNSQIVGYSHRSEFSDKLILELRTFPTIKDFVESDASEPYLEYIELV